MLESVFVAGVVFEELVLQGPLCALVVEAVDLGTVVGEEGVQVLLAGYGEVD